jgi:hypothetical protein
MCSTFDICKYVQNIYIYTTLNIINGTVIATGTLCATYRYRTLVLCSGLQ